MYAHTPGPDGRWHDLDAHLEAVATLAAQHASKFGGEDPARLAGLWHDIGKANPDFQSHLEAVARGEHVTPGSVPHAVFGAVYAVEAGVELLAPGIFGHHAGLPDPPSLKAALSDPETRATYEEKIAPVLQFGRGLKRMMAGDRRGEHMGWADFGTRPPQDRLALELYLRMIFSALVDSDYTDTEAHFDPDKAALRAAGSASIEDLWRAFGTNQAQLLASVPDTPVNRVRREVYLNCLRAATAPRGTFQLTVPTGGGKTRAALGFGLKHAFRHGLDRIIVAVPYTSITEQATEEYRKILGPEEVLEHHSAVGEGSQSFRSQFASQNWHAPIVVTTTIQLFESLLGARPGRCRKLHNIARSVIVIDEVQTLPLRLLAPILSVLRALVESYGVTAVLSTATQPALEGESRYLQGFQNVRDIVPPERALAHFRELKRVRYEVESGRPWSWPEVAGRVRQAATEERAMVVVNTRRDALAILDALGAGTLHLSTLLCGAHRRKVLDEVRCRLRAGERCMLATTQDVEVGVDLDFPVVFRAMGPLDRIVQAAGRCNREGTMPDLGRVVIFEPSEGRTPFGEYAMALAQTRALLRRSEVDLHDSAIFRRYFERMYQSVSTDAHGIQDLRRRLDYPGVSERFRIIDEARTPVIIPYDQRAEGIIERIREEGELRRGDDRRLQSYVVDLYQNEIGDGDTEEIAEEVMLWTGEYDEVRGVRLAE